MKTVVRHSIFLFALAATALVAGCGRTEAAPPVLESPKVEAPPPVDPFAKLVLTCANAAPEAARVEAGKYCRCIYKAAADRWTYPYYATHVAQCEAELEKEESQRCHREALQ